MTDDLYRRHEEAVLRRLMARVRSPEVAAELTAETFAHALAAERDASRQSESDWLAGLADEALEEAYRTGVVGCGWRTRAGMAPVAVDARSLDRIWRLRGPGRDTARKPRVSPALIVAERTLAGAALLPTVEAAWLAAGRSRRGVRRSRRRAAVVLRVAIALVSAGVVLGPALVPDRPARAADAPQWLPFAQGGVEGHYPRLWHLSSALRSPVVVATFPTGDACEGLAWMEDTDAAVVFDRDRAAVERCAPDARLERRGLGLIVLGPAATDEARATAREILDRARRA